MLAENKFKQDAKDIQNISRVNMRQLEGSTESVTFFQVVGLHPPHPQGWGSGVARVSIGFTKKVYKTKYKSNNNFSEHHHFDVGRHFCYFFLSPKTELKSKFSTPFTILNLNKVNRLACEIWTDLDNNLAVKIIFF